MNDPEITVKINSQELIDILSELENALDSIRSKIEDLDNNPQIVERVDTRTWWQRLLGDPYPSNWADEFFEVVNYTRRNKEIKAAKELENFIQCIETLQAFSIEELEISLHSLSRLNRIIENSKN